MFTGPLNRMICARSLLYLLLLVATLAVVGCGSKDESKTAAMPSGERMVPVNVGGTVADSTLVPDSTLIGEPTAAAGSPPATAAEALTPMATPPVAKADSRPAGGSAARATVGTISLQVGSFRSAENAGALVRRLRDLGYAPVVEVATLGGQTYHRVVLEGLASRAAAERLGEDIRSRLGITYLIRQK